MSEDRSPRLSVVGSPRPDPAAPERRVTRRGMISRDRILAEALALLAEEGYPGVSISSVCKRAEVSPASLYHHFGDKAGLLAAMIERSIVDSIQGFVDVIEEAPRPIEKLKAFVEATRKVGKEDPGNIISVLAALTLARGDSPEIAAAVEEARKRAWRFSAAEYTDRFGFEDGMFFTHITFAFAHYIDHVAKTSDARDDARHLYETYERVMVLTAAAARPEFLEDPEYMGYVLNFRRAVSMPSISVDGETS